MPWLMVVVDTLKRDSDNIVEEKVESGLLAVCEWAFESNIKFSEYMPTVLFVIAILFLLLEWKNYMDKERAFIVFSGSLFLLSYAVCMALASQMHHFWHNRYLIDVLFCLVIYDNCYIAKKHCGL
ncbi:MAG: hypothetical protein NC417_14615 [Candidatus Gastranaerophilales bacterium]|nr:hypothetical protein [Candidatus Gastranaerophilales bacterium]